MSNALRGFDKLKSWVDQLAEIHARIGSVPGGRREQEALYRAGVVMTVAAWESYVEAVLIEAMTALTPAGTATVGERTTWVLACVAAQQAAKRFNTPNAQNVSSLMETHLGLSIEPAWAITLSDSEYTAAQAKTRINAWLDIRHKVAHGGTLPTDVPWIRDPSGRPRMTLGLMTDCRDFFRELAVESDTAIAAHLVERFGLAVEPW